MSNSSWIVVEDFKRGNGWVRSEQREARSRAYCELLEQGEVSFGNRRFACRRTTRNFC